MTRVVVDVTLKPEILDPQGQAILGALGRLGYAGVTGVRLMAVTRAPRAPARRRMRTADVV